MHGYPSTVPAVNYTVVEIFFLFAFKWPKCLSETSHPFLLYEIFYSICGFIEQLNSNLYHVLESGFIPLKITLHNLFISALPTNTTLSVIELTQLTEIVNRESVTRHAKKESENTTLYSLHRRALFNFHQTWVTIEVIAIISPTTFSDRFNKILQKMPHQG